MLNHSGRAENYGTKSPLSREISLNLRALWESSGLCNTWRQRAICFWLGRDISRLFSL
jgi:hypothetical protein